MMRGGDSSEDHMHMRGVESAQRTAGGPPVEPANVLTTQTKPCPRAVASVVTSARVSAHAAGQRHGSCVAGVGQKKPAGQARDASAGGDGEPDAVGDVTAIGAKRSTSKKTLMIKAETSALERRSLEV
jgi:hypothetical protein